jgi:hypothetical protein
MEPISTGTAIGLMLASAAMSTYAQHAAAKKQQDRLRESQMRQQAAQNSATDKVVKRSMEFDAQTRNDKQAEIEQALTADLTKHVDQPLITAQGVQVGSTIPDAEGTGDFLKHRARETARAHESLRALAALMGKTGAAGELRRREAVSIGDTAGDVGRIASGANNIWQADQAGIAAAGQPSVGLMLGSAALGAYGQAGMAGAGVGGAAPAAGTGFTPSGPSGLGFKPPSAGLGLKARGPWL